MKEVNVLEIATEYGAGTRGASLGPDAVHIAFVNQKSDLLKSFPIKRIDIDPTELLEPVTFPSAKRIQRILDHYREVVKEIRDILENGNKPFVISGDHSNAGAVIAGLRLARPDRKLGVVWIDAHGDLHTPFTSPSGNMHGMPVALSLGVDNKAHARTEPDPAVLDLWNKMAELGGVQPKINSEDLVMIGLRDLEAQEWALIEEHNILHWQAEQVDHEGTSSILERTLKYLDSCDDIYVSFDIDSVDAAIVPGTGTPVTRGLSIGQAESLLKGLWQNEKLICMEFTEINPLLDLRNQTAELAARLLQNILGG